MKCVKLLIHTQYCWSLLHSLLIPFMTDDEIDMFSGWKKMACLPCPQAGLAHPRMPRRQQLRLWSIPGYPDIFAWKTHRIFQNQHLGWWNSMGPQPAAALHVLGWFFSVGHVTCVTVSCWWFQTFFIVHNIWDNPSHWLIFFKMVKTTNLVRFHVVFSFDGCLEKIPSVVNIWSTDVRRI